MTRPSFVLSVIVAVGLAFLPAFFTALGIGQSVLSFVSPLPYPLSLAGPVVMVWFAIGLIYLAWLGARHPERIRDTGRVFIDEPDTITAPGTFEP